MAKKKIRKNVIKGIAHINATFNNTIITISDVNGETLCWDSAGTVGFKGARKATPFAATRAAERVAAKARRMGMRREQVHSGVTAQSKYEYRPWVLLLSNLIVPSS